MADVITSRTQPRPRRRPRRAAKAPGHLRVVPAKTRSNRSRPRQRAAPARTEREVTLLLVSATALTLIGLVMVLSASSVSAFDRFGSSFLFFNRQAAYAVIGVGAAVLTSRMRPVAWQRLCGPLLVACAVLLALVLHPSAGTVAGGSARWIAIGPITIQPSELAKLAVVTFAATLLARRWRDLHDVRRLLFPLVPVVGAVCGLVLMQPDLGTAVIIAGIVFVLWFAAGARVKHLAVGGLSAVTLGLAAIYAEGYRWARLMSFANPWADPQGNGYQAIQSLIGLGSGGLFGVGLGASRQKWLYVPNAHTDFIYSIIGEELGLLGALTVLSLFAVLVYAGIRIAFGAPDAFGRLLAAGITGWIGLQAVVNLGAVTGLLPITGVPLPFVSFGGSSLIVSLAAVGVLASVGRQAGGRSRASASSREGRRAAPAG